MQDQGHRLETRLVHRESDVRGSGEVVIRSSSLCSPSALLHKVSERAQEHCTKCEIRHEVYGAR